MESDGRQECAPPVAVPPAVGRRRTAELRCPDRPFPGALYDGHGWRLAGDGPARLTHELTEALPHKAVVHDNRPGAVEVVVLRAGDRFWLLPETFGDPPALPAVVLAELAEVVRRGHKLGFGARCAKAYALVRDALMLLLNEAEGRA